MCFSKHLKVSYGGARVRQDSSLTTFLYHVVIAGVKVTFRLNEGSFKKVFYIEFLSLILVISNVYLQIIFLFVTF